jgi:hypothetical protein
VPFSTSFVLQSVSSPTQITTTIHRDECDDARGDREKNGKQSSILYRLENLNAHEVDDKRSDASSDNRQKCVYMITSYAKSKSIPILQLAVCGVRETGEERENSPILMGPLGS